MSLKLFSVAVQNIEKSLALKRLFMEAGQFENKHKAAIRFHNKKLCRKTFRSFNYFIQLDKKYCKRAELLHHRHQAYQKLAFFKKWRKEFNTVNRSYLIYAFSVIAIKNTILVISLLHLY
jgi:hypothetical protein